jgi:hypothetical protein
MTKTLIRNRLAVLVAAAPMVMGLGACGGNDVSAGSATTGQSNNLPGESNPEFSWELKFTRCLRDQGINIGDPDPVTGVPSVVHDAGYKAASAACRGTVGDQPVTAGKGSDAKKLEASLKLVRCLRDLGVPIVDPAPNQAPAVPEGTSEDTINKCLNPQGK